MRKRVTAVFALLLILSATSVLAQEDLSVIGEVDYYNATRYCGARNSARTPQGDLVVVFEPGSDYTNQDIWYYTYNSIFGSWDPAQQLSHSTENATGVPAVVADDSGRIYATWKEKWSDGRRHLMFAVWKDGLWSDPVQAQPDTFSSNVGVNTVDLADDGTIFTLFSIWNDPAIFPANIYSTHSSDGGKTWLLDNLTAEYPTPNVLPFNWMDVNLAAGKNGTMFACWEDKEPSTNAYEVFLSIYRPDSGWTTPEAVTPIHDGAPRAMRWLDGCTPVEGAQPVYVLGDTSYMFHDKAAAIDYTMANGSEVLSFFFNMYFTPEDQRNEIVADVMNYFGTGKKVLLVDDDNRYNNEGIMTAALDAAGVSYSVFDCGDSDGMATAVPPADTLNAYDVVIWFAGDDGKALALWNIADEDNEDLKTYLDQGNKKLWLIGSDWLYDRYKKAPDSFAEGDMCYDYFGIASYDVQTYADDNKQGVTELDLVPGTPVTDVNPITFGTTGGTRQGVPSIATDPSGNLHLVYYDAKTKHILYQIFDGSTWTAPVQLDTCSNGDLDRPNISIDPNYGVYVTWIQKVDTIRQVFYNTSPDGGKTWNGSAQLSNAEYVNQYGNSVFNPTIGRKVRPAIEGVFKGGADVTWTEWNPNSSLGYYLMYARIPYVGTLSKPSGMKILLVDDDDYSRPDHLPRIEETIEAAGYTYTLFGAADSGRSPTADEMSAFDLVVWYTANDGVGQQFWAGQDTLNQELKSYLDNGGKLWVIGNDVIYDRYGKAPDDFAPGDFLYDYLGVARYVAQSKADDGGVGVPMLLRYPKQNICSVDTLKWYFSSGGLWYADGCTPVEGAVPVYLMGPDTYPLAGLAAAIYYDNGTSKVLSCFFDPYYMDTPERRTAFFKDVLSFFENPVFSRVESEGEDQTLPRKHTVLQNYPNPFNPATTLAFDLPRTERVRLVVYDLRGRAVATLVDGVVPAGHHTRVWNAGDLPSGIYLARLTAGSYTRTVKLVLAK